MYNTSYTTWSYGTFYNPEVHIAVNNNRIKTYTIDNENQVYLPDGTEFQLEFYNSSDVCVKAEITINGKTQSHALVLKPNQRFYLDRFMDEKKKFKFNTFMTGDDDIEKLKEIIAQNGRIEIKFYKEFVLPVVQRWPDTWTTYPIFTGSTYKQQYFGDNFTTCNYNASTQMKGVSKNTFRSMDTYSDNTSLSIKETETGRVESGNKSKQDFTPVQKQWDIFSCTTWSYHIMPESKRPKQNLKSKKIKNVIQADDIRSYCPTCGRRVKKGHNFCPGCGGKF